MRVDKRARQSLRSSMQSFVYIKRVAPSDARAFSDEVFVPVDTDGVASVGVLTVRACAQLEWGAPTRARLFRVAVSGRAPLPAELDAALRGEPLSPFDSLAAVGVFSGACLVALLPPPAPAPPPNAGGGGFDLAAAFARLETATTLLARISARLLAEDSATTILSDAEYEDMARLKLPSILLDRCGLEVVRGADASRTVLAGLEWDFRVPVLVAATAPNPNAERGAFEVFPNKAHYERPAAVPARIVTPTKVGTAAEPPPAHYLAIFEMTVAPKWTRRSSAREGLLERLEARLALSLDRAFSSGVCERDVLALVAVVGVVAPAPYSDSVRERMSRADAPPLLRQMMDAARFVFIGVPKARANSRE
jgi:hypothetical protein